MYGVWFQLNCATIVPRIIVPGYWFMKKILGIIVLGLLLSGCETTTVGYHEHYDKCILVSSGSSIDEISSCGKQSRLAYLDASKSEGSKEGDTYMMWVDLLAQQVKDGEISETEAKMKLIERQLAISQKVTDRQQAAYNAYTSSTTNCTSTVIGNSVSTSCY